MVETMLMAVSKWAVDNLGVKESLKDVGTEVLKRTVWRPLKKKIIGFFEDEKQADTFMREISESEAINIRKPYRDIEDVYENIKGVPSEEELFNTIANFFLENSDIIREANLNIEVNNGLRINQVAGRDIVNIKKAKMVKIDNR